MSHRLRVGLTRDFLSASGTLVYRDIGLSLLEQAGVEYAFFETRTDEIQPEQLMDLDAAIVLSPKVTAHSLSGNPRLSLIARFGVGYDTVDLAACTNADVMLTITRGSVNHAVAEAILCLMLALAKRLFVKNRLVRDGRFGEKIHHMGCDLMGKVVGSVGLGGIGSRMFELLQPFRLSRALAFDPYADAARVSSLGVELVDFETLLRTSDFVCINCPLSEETQGLMNAEAFALMKPTAYLINTARGPIVDESALFHALTSGGIQGAASDVFCQEPPPVDHPLLSLDNFIATPHGLAWTDELFLATGAMACQSVLSAFRGNTPDHVVNTDVIARTGLQAKLATYRG